MGLYNQILQVMWQTFCLVFSCHISSAPFMCKQAACLQTVRLPSPLPSANNSLCATAPSLCHTVPHWLPLPWLSQFTRPDNAFLPPQRQTGSTADHQCSSHGSLAVAVGTGVPGQGFPLILPVLLRDTGSFEGQDDLLLWQHSTH